MAGADVSSSHSRSSNGNDMYINPQDMFTPESSREEDTRSLGSSSKHSSENQSQKLSRRQKEILKKKEKNRLREEHLKTIPHPCMRDTYWIKEEFTNDEEVIERFANNTKTNLLNKTYNKPSKVKLSVVG